MQPTDSDIKVMQILVGEAWGGAERFFVKLANAFERRNLRQKIVILRDAKRAADLREGGCDVLELDFGKSWKDVLARVRLQRAVNQFKPDIVIVWMNRAARRMPYGSFVKVARLGGYYPLKYYQKCDWLIGNTPDLVRYMIEDESWPENRTKVISNFGELTSMPKVSRASLGTPEDAFLILSLGRLHPSKGFDTLLETVSLVPNVHLWLAGQGDLQGELEAQAAHLGVTDRVRFLGWRNDQAALYSACDVCVVPSRHEPLSNVIVEAWSLKVPVVATSSEGPSWLVDDEQNGLLSPIDDAVSLANNIERLIGDNELLEKISAGGYEKWKRSFSEKAIVDSYFDFFKQIMRK